MGRTMGTGREQPKLLPTPPQIFWKYIKIQECSKYAKYFSLFMTTARLLALGRFF
jgi:hypothetical protein